MTVLPLKHLPVKVPRDDPFAHDAFERQKLVEPLTQILDSVDHPFVFAVTAPWGTGKTTFVNQWATQLENDGWTVIRFNAWENDFSDSALATMIAELGRGIKAIETNHDGPVKTAAKKVAKTGEAMARRLVPATIKAVTFGAFDVDEDVRKVVEEAISGTEINIIKQYEESKKSIAKFKEALGGLVSKLAETDPSTKLVIVVDELDRCRPNFAIEMLEVMKHLFDVNGVIFVLAADVQQLQGSVAAIYGSAIDGKEYLRRFIDMQFALRTPPAEQLVKHLWTQSRIDRFIELRNRHSGDAQDVANLRTSLIAFAKLFPKSVRFHEHLMTRLSAVLRTVKPRYRVYEQTLVFLLHLRELRPDAYEQFCCRLLPPRRAIEILFDGVDAERFLKSRAGIYLEAELIAAVTSHEHQPIKQYRVEAEQNLEDPQSSRSHHICEIVERWTPFDEGWIDYLVPKIELTDQLVDLDQDE